MGEAPRRPWSLAGVAVLASVVAGAVTAPSSWWAVAFVPAFGWTAAAARPYVPASYRDGWPRAVIVATSVVALGSACYAAAFEPFGPSPFVATVLGMLALTVLIVAVGGRMTEVRGYGARGYPPR